MSDATDKKPPRKFPPPCWTQEEALVLIESYRERWYALRRGYLRTADWDAVAAAVGQRFPGASPPKTPAQCRHKMEKLRQRYRVEKQRSLASYPGRFFSSWFFFESMDSMEHGSVGSNQDNQENHQNLVTIGFYPKDVEKIEGDLNLGNRNSGPLIAKSRVLNGFNRYAEHGSDEDADEGGPFRGEFHVKTPVNGSFIPQEYRTNKSAGKMYRNPTTNFNGGCQLNTQIEQDSGFRAKKSGKWEDGSYNRADVNGDFWVKVAGGRSPAAPPFVSGNINLNPNSSAPPAATERRKGSGGVKRGRGPVAEMVESIRFLGEGFIEMEKMKMDMMKEIEKMRMEMEVKRNEMLLKSQQQIAGAFIKGLIYVKNNKVKTSVPPDS